MAVFFGETELWCHRMQGWQAISKTWSSMPGVKTITTVNPPPPWPSKPWSRLHLDFAGPFLGDVYSKWMDVQMKNSSAKTVEKLRLPMDYPSKLLQTMELQQWIPPVHGNKTCDISTVPSIKQRLSRVGKSKLSKERSNECRICQSRRGCLLSYRITPHSTTGIALVKLLMGHMPRSLFDNLHPDISQRVELSKSCLMTHLYLYISLKFC